MYLKIPESLGILLNRIQVEVTVFGCEIKNTGQVLFQFWRCKQTEYTLRVVGVHKLRAQYWVVKVIELFLSWARPIAPNSLLHAGKLIFSLVEFSVTRCWLKICLYASMEFNSNSLLQVGKIRFVHQSYDGKYVKLWSPLCFLSVSTLLEVTGFWFCQPCG